MERNAFAQFDIFVSFVMKVFEPNAMGAYVLRLDCSFWVESSPIMLAYPATVELALSMTMICLFFLGGCFDANWQAFPRSLFRFVKSSPKFEGTNFFEELEK